MIFHPFSNTINWKQHAVGHGGFHTGQIVDKNGRCFTWIFDCGARSRNQFDGYLHSWTKRQNAPVDWLFLSHFDLDHVSGLDRLMSQCVVQDVMVPYVNDEELAYTLLEEISRGNLEKSFVELVADPTTFFLSRGATRVTFLKGRNPEESDEYELARPTEPHAQPSDDKHDQYWETQICKPISTRARHTTPATSAKPTQMEIIEGGTCNISIASGSVTLDLKPFCAPIPHAANHQLLKDIKTLVNKGHRQTKKPGLRSLAYAIALHARTEKGRADIKSLYKKHAGSSNRASLSLLSKPIDFTPLAGFLYTPNSLIHWLIHDECAWMNTGDAELLKQSDLADWENCFRPHLSNIQVLALPHHGSDKNSDRGLQATCPNAILTAHVTSNSPHHPGGNVSLYASNRLARVTEYKSTSISMMVKGN